MQTGTYHALKPVTVALAVLLAGTSLALPVVAADKTDTETTLVTGYQGWGDPAMAEIAVNSGRALINHLMTAKAGNAGRQQPGRSGECRCAVG